MVDTCSVVKTGETLAVIDVDLTPLPRKPERTSTAVMIDVVETPTTVQARVARAFVSFHLTSVTDISIKALTLVRVYPVDTSGAIFTWAAEALVDILVTEEPSETWIADANESSNRVNASGTICARTTAALVDVNRAVDSTESAHALAEVRRNPIVTSAAILAGGVHLALVDLVLTLHAEVARETRARVSIHPINTTGSVLAGRGGTVVYVHLTHPSGVPGLARARVGSITIDALATVQAVDPYAIV